MLHRNAPLSVEGRRRLIQRCQARPIAHVAAEMGISRQCASKWVNRYRRFGDAGLLDRPSAPLGQPTATPARIVTRIEAMRRDHKWSARRIAHELAADGVTVSVRTVSRQLVHLGLNRRRFLDPTGETNRAPRRIHARWPGHMVHLDVKKVGVIPDDGSWRVHGRGSEAAKQSVRGRTRGGRGRYTYLHTAIDRYSRLAYTEALPDETARTAIGFTHRARAFRARAFLARHGIRHVHHIVTDNGACYRATDFATEFRHRSTRRTPPAHHALHPTPQRQGGALPPHPGRRTPLRPHLDQRTTTISRTGHLEHPLQLPSTTHCRRKPATNNPAPHQHHQHHGLIHLVVGTDDFGVRSWICG
jgi:transposase